MVLVTMLLMILSTGCKHAVVTASVLPTTDLTASVGLPTQTEYQTEQITEESTLPEQTTIATSIESTEVSEVASETTVPGTETSQGATGYPDGDSRNYPETTEQESTTVETTISTTTAPKYTFVELSKYMYCQGDTHVRTEPNIESRSVIVFELNRRVYVSGKCNETGWYRIEVEGQTLYMSDVMLADSEYIVATQPSTPPTTVAPTTAKPVTNETASGFVYYVAPYTNPDYNLELYLYEQLNICGIGWYYKYAVAQIAQESNWNPNSTNGRDHGLCQFKGIYWDERCQLAGLPGADIWNPYHQIYVYARFMMGILASCNNNVERALSLYITGTWDQWHQFYIDCIMERYKGLIAK